LQQIVVRRPAGPGIGQAVAKRFGREGWTIVLSGRNAARLEILKAELTADGILALAVPVDATRTSMIGGGRLAATVGRGLLAFLMGDLQPTERPAPISAPLIGANRSFG
jgi:NAD(P)-dependent dehydrogenase (short-subunit alcohol dehydrogenase family)